MASLYRKVVVQSILGIAFFLAVIFVSAGTLHYWQAWVFIAVFSLSTTGFTVYLALFDKPLLQRRMNAGPWKEGETSQKVIVSLIVLGFLALMVFPALDHRYGMSPVPVSVSLLGDLFIILSFLFIFWVLKVNSFAAANIEVAEGQKVIDSGPYAYVRHPMYAGAFWLLVGMPLALGSWWSLFIIIPFLPVLMWRLLDEERFLHKNLPDYTEYTTRVRSRLVPYLW